MTFKEKIEANPFISLIISCSIVGSIVAAIIIWHYQMLLSGHDLVEKDSYTLNSKLTESWVPKKDYDLILKKVKILDDKPINPIVIDPVRRIKIINNDSIDLYAIKILKCDTINDYAISLRDTIKNQGYGNTEFFLSIDNNFYLMIYGFACIGKGIKRVENSVKKILHKKECNIECVNLSTHSPEGFIEYKKNTVFQYYTPRSIYLE